MRHRKGFNHLSRKSSHRKAMLANMASSLILHKRIKTTTAKAKALRMYVEPLITKSKDDSTHSRRVVFSYLQNKEAVTELFREVSPKITDRPGGYTRILKTGNRLGDNAEMCVMELVDYNENLLAAKEESAAKSGKRRRRGSKKKTEESAVQEAAVAESTETITEEVVTTEESADAEGEEKVDEIKTETVEEKKEEVESGVEEVEAQEEKEEEVKAEAAKDNEESEAEEEDKKDEDESSSEKEKKEE